MLFSPKKVTISVTLIEPYSSPLSFAAISLINFNSFIFEAVFESLIGTSIAVGLGWGFIQYSKTSFIAESIFDIAISDSYLINLTLVLLLSTIIFGFFASFVGIRKVLND